MRGFRLSWAVLLALLIAMPLHAAPPRVVVSIKPLYGLVAGVMQGVGEPTLLLTGAGSPHSHTLRPSEARLLADADLVFWIGPEMEGFLGPVLARLLAQERFVALSRLPGVRQWPNRPPGIWSGEVGSGAGHDHGGDHDHAPGRMDPHLWLDPDNAVVLVTGIAKALGDRFPAQARTFSGNADRLARRIRLLDQALAKRLAPFGNIPYLVYHDAFQYFERRYGLKGVGAITLHPEQPPGARRISEVREALAVAGVRCLFTESGFQPRILESLLDGHRDRVRTAALDVLGLQLPTGDQHYFQLLFNLADAVAGCLGPPSGHAP